MTNLDTSSCLLTIDIDIFTYFRHQWRIIKVRKRHDELTWYLKSADETNNAELVKQVLTLVISYPNTDKQTYIIHV